VNLLVAVAFLLEIVPQKLQLTMKAVMITKSFGPVHQCGNRRVLVGWVAMRTGVYIEASRGRFAVYLMAQNVIVSSVNICVQERKLVISLHLHGELRILLETWSRQLKLQPASCWILAWLIL
jgi:hypothetical protein